MTQAIATRQSSDVRRCLTRGTLAFLVASTVLTPMARAEDIVFNTDLGTFTVNGMPATSYGGVAITNGGVSASDNSRQFLVHGDLSLKGNLFTTAPADTLTAVGSRPLNLQVGNNFNVGLGATVNVSAQGRAAGVGGGTGGFGGAAGAGGAEATGFGALGGSGGSGGHTEVISILGIPISTLHEPDSGRGGRDGGFNRGNAGGGGAAGTAGGTGVNAAGGGGSAAASVAGAPGGGGTTGGGSGNLGGGRGSDGFLAGIFPIPASNGGGGGNGFNGGNGHAGSSVTFAAPRPGAGSNVAAVATALTGGGGGAGGSGGGGGGSGASGTSGGGGGGGGGGGYFATLPPFSVAGGDGGHGGDGGNGGVGGQGGTGGQGGDGGAGGGAILIQARGAVTMAGQVLSQGGAATGGTAGSGGGAGGAGAAGLPGQAGRAGDGPFSGSGGTGGNGGSGGTGGNGGAGGSASGGGGGSGGTVKILSSAAFSIFGGSIDTSGGTGGANPVGAPSPAGGMGRVVIGTTASNSSLVVSNASQVDASAEAPMAANPYAGPTVLGFAPQTPLVAPGMFSGLSMVGGANSFGLLPISALDDPNLAADIAGAPSGSSSFIDLSPVGPRGFANTIPGYEYLTFVNFGTTSLDLPELMGVGLQSFGFADDIAFGGDGLAHLLTELAPGQVFVALVPDLGDTLSNYGFGHGGRTFGGSFNSSGVAYDNIDASAVPEPHSLALLGAGMAGIGLVRRRRGAQSLPGTNM